MAESQTNSVRAFDCVGQALRAMVLRGRGRIGFDFVGQALTAVDSGQ